MNIVGILKLGELSQFVISIIRAEFCVADTVLYYVFVTVESLDFHSFEHILWVAEILGFLLLFLFGWVFLLFFFGGFGFV